MTERSLESEVRRAVAAGASDLHLEAGLGPAIRVRGEIRREGDPVPAATVLAWARRLIGEREWPAFLERRSADLSASLGGVRCRFNVFRTSRGAALAARLLPGTQPSLASLNLHPDLSELAHETHGLILVSGPTGSGKSSTIAALAQEINRRRSCHILTVEQPIEFVLRPRQAFVRQREVGRDTPSFEQALRDALREDPDVLVVGELRHPEVMQLALEAAETGHLVLTTMHAGTCSEVLQRLVTAMPPSMQSNVRAQLAEVLRAVLCQRLVFEPELKLRLPELEVLMASHAVKHLVRQGEFHKVGQAMEVGQRDGHWTLDRYRSWMDENVGWHIPDPVDPGPAPGEDEALDRAEADEAAWSPAPASAPTLEPERPLASRPPEPESEDDVIVIDPPGAGSLSDIISELEDRGRGGSR